MKTKVVIQMPEEMATESFILNTCENAYAELIPTCFVMLSWSKHQR